MSEMNETNDHAEHPSDDLAAFALGALDSAEEARVREHLEGCDRCRSELQWLRPAVDVLPASVPQVEPPPRLKRKLMKSVRADAREQRGGWWSRSAGWISLRARPALVVAAAAVFGAGVAGYAVNAIDDTDGGGAETVTEVRAEPQGTAKNAAAVLTRTGDQAVLEVEHLPKLSDGVYQLWVREGNVLSPRATFGVDDQNHAEATVGEIPAGADEVLVTREPEGGSDQPTSSPLLRAPVS